MTNLPFGFGPSDPDPDRDRDQDGRNASGGNGDANDAGSGASAGGPPNPFAAFGLPLGGGDMSGMPLFAELGKLLSWSGGPVNWDLARQLASAGVSGASQVVGDVDRTATRRAVELADLWLDDVTDLPSGVRTVDVWSRSDWVARTIDGWSALCDPVAGRVVTAMSAATAEMAPQAGPLGQVMGSFSGLMFGAQVGQGLAGLAAETVSTAEIGLPLAATGTVALLPQNVRELAAGLERPEDEVRLYLALREAATQRLYAHVPWLRGRVIEAVEAYSRGITVDTSTLRDLATRLDPNDLSSMQTALSEGMHTPEDTPAQKAALEQLETLLALIEGWADTVVDQAAGSRLAGAAALREAMRRRRASGGPAEQTFETLVGLHLRPRRLRDAATLWWALTDQVGASRRDEVWEFPDLLPSAADLDDPLDYARRVKASNISDVDAAGVVEAFEALTQAAAHGGSPSGDADSESDPSAPDVAVSDSDGPGSPESDPAGPDPSGQDADRPEDGPDPASPRE